MDSQLGTELMIASEIHLQGLVSMRQKALCSKPLLTGGVGIFLILPVALSNLVHSMTQKQVKWLNTEPWRTRMVLEVDLDKARMGTRTRDSLITLVSELLQLLNMEDTWLTQTTSCII